MQDDATPPRIVDIGETLEPLDRVTMRLGETPLLEERIPEIGEGVGNPQ